MLRIARLLRVVCSRSRVMAVQPPRANFGVLLLLAISVNGIAQTAPSYERAERQREALAARPASSRTRLEYKRVLNAFRVIYHTDPRAPKADASVLAVAGLLA